MPQLWLDCDGVLADFDFRAAQIFGEPPQEAEARLGSALFWKILYSHKDFYRRLPLRHDALALYDAVRHLNPKILTGCPKDGWAEEQKIGWANARFPGVPVTTCPSRHKSLHMQPGDILIDDQTKYRHLWEKAGGHYIVFKNAKQAIHELFERFPALKAGASSGASA